MAPRSRLAQMAVALSLLIVLFVPWTRRTIRTDGVLRPRAVERLEAPEDGTVVAVFVRESSAVRAGDPVFRIESLSVEAALTHFAGERQRFARAASAARETVAPAVVYEKERRESAADSAWSNEDARKQRLTLRSPVAGRILTQRPEDLEGRFVTAGTSLAEVGDCEKLVAELPVSERQLDELRLGARVRALLPQRSMQPVLGRVVRISPATLDQPRSVAGLDDPVAPGAQPDRFVAQAMFDNPDGLLRPGDLVRAKIDSDRASYAGRIWRLLRRWLQTIFW